MFLDVNVMSNLSLWFFYQHYTECFCHVKKCATLRHDSKLNPTEIYALNFIDGLMRENSYIASVASGFITSAAVAGFVSVNLHAEGNKSWILGKIAIGAVVMWNLQKIMDASSHIGMMLIMPRVFLILDEGLPENSTIRKETQEIIAELSRQKI